jgi:predicted double-glycine peptidase
MAIRLLKVTNRVPHYEQQYEFTCGPASLMMVFRHFDKKFKFDKKLETDIWRESSLAPLPPTSRYGLAFSALKRGFRVEILTNVRGIEYINKTPARLTGGRRADFMKMLTGVMEEQFQERKHRATHLGLRENMVKKIKTGQVESTLERGGLSIMLTSARFFEDQDWAHWVVVTGIDGKNAYINDPASSRSKGRRNFSRQEFEEINGYYGDQVLISIFQK